MYCMARDFQGPNFQGLGTLGFSEKIKDRK